MDAVRTFLWLTFFSAVLHAFATTPPFDPLESREITDHAGNILRRSVQDLDDGKLVSTVELIRPSGSKEVIFTQSSAEGWFIDQAIKMGYPRLTSFQLTNDRLDLYYRPDGTGGDKYRQFKKEGGSWKKTLGCSLRMFGSAHPRDITWLGPASFSVGIKPPRDVFWVEECGPHPKPYPSLVYRNGKPYVYEEPGKETPAMNDGDQGNLFYRTWSQNNEGRAVITWEIASRGGPREFVHSWVESDQALADPLRHVVFHPLDSSTFYDKDDLNLGRPAPFHFRLDDRSLDVFYIATGSEEMAIAHFEKLDGQWKWTKWMPLFEEFSLARSYPEGWVGESKFTIRQAPEKKGDRPTISTYEIRGFYDPTTPDHDIALKDGKPWHPQKGSTTVSSSSSLPPTTKP